MTFPLVREPHWGNFFRHLEEFIPNDDREEEGDGDDSDYSDNESPSRKQQRRLPNARGERRRFQYSQRHGL